MNGESPVMEPLRRTSRLRNKRVQNGKDNRQPAKLLVNYDAQPVPLQVAARLEPNTDPLTELQARHLLRRTQFGATPAQINAIVGRPANEVVDEIVLAARNVPLPANPSWYNSLPNEQNEDTYFELSAQWFEVEIMPMFFSRLSGNALAEKMTLFWQNHFVTRFFDSLEIAPLTYRYVNLLRTHAFGDFKAFVNAIGLDMTMLVFLDGVENMVGAPNENYARELCELFTMGIFDQNGQPNYTENDVSEIARALTGYFIDEDTWQVVFEEERYDAGTKTIFGQTGQWGYTDVVDLLFSQRSSQIAYHICQKLYKEFVYEAPQADIVAELAQGFEAGNFDINSTLTTLLKSRHFFDAAFNVARIKSPFECFAGFLMDLDISSQNDDEIYTELVYASEDAGQLLLNPPNVGGFPGYRTWLSTSSVPSRWESLGYVSFDLVQRDTLMAFINAVHDQNDALAVFNLPIAIVNHMIGAPMDTLSIQPISAPWSGGQPIPAEIEQRPEYEHHLAKQMLAGIPWYEWDLNSEEAEYALREFIVYVCELPEYQLA